MFSLSLCPIDCHLIGLVVSSPAAFISRTLFNHANTQTRVLLVPQAHTQTWQCLEVFRQANVASSMRFSFPSPRRRRLLTVFIAIVVALMINVCVRVCDTMMMKSSCILLIRRPVNSRVDHEIQLGSPSRRTSNRAEETRADERKDACSSPY